jgi:hypothetical protein
MFTLRGSLRSLLALTETAATDHERAGPSYPGTVLLDIGGETGALVLRARVEDQGREIDVRRVADGACVHSEIRPRILVRGTVYCAVYPDLSAGQYTIEGCPFSITGGKVTEMDLPAARGG